MPNLSLLQKTQIVTLLEEGWSIRALAQRFEVNKSTILRAKRKWQQERVVQRKNGSGRKRVRTPEDDENLIQFLQERVVQRKNGSGRKRVRTPEDDENLIQFLRNNAFESVVTAINRTNFPGHVRTARNRVRQDSDLRNRVAAKKPFLTADNKNQRIDDTEEDTNKEQLYDNQENVDNDPIVNKEAAINNACGWKSARHQTDNDVNATGKEAE
ncbi:hypothetical protein QE152_g27645 [Popillia japonica]|uniref:Transposase n=1 Tax=Popillia japonica TaxID=7064 RepID=A0AAW1JVI0_POPJA